MGYLNDLALSLSQQIDTVSTVGEKDALIRALAAVRQAIGGGGGGGGGVATSPADIASGINQAIDIDTLIAKITSLENKTPLNRGFSSTATIQRAADVVRYDISDKYGNTFELANFGLAGGHVILSGVRAIFNFTSLPAGMGNFLLYLYSVTPPTVVTDNGAFSVPPADRLVLLTPGGIDVGTATAAVGGGSIVMQSDNLNIQLKLSDADTSVWGCLVTRSAFTPAAPSETATITALTLGV